MGTSPGPRLVVAQFELHRAMNRFLDSGKLLEKRSEAITDVQRDGGPLKPGFGLRGAVSSEKLCPILRQDRAKEPALSAVEGVGQPT